MKKIWAFLKNKWKFLKGKKIPLPLYAIVIVFFVFGAMFFCCSRSSKIGIVDMSRVYAEAEIFKAIHNDQVTFKTEWKEQALAQKEELEQADKALSRKKSRMKKVQFEKEAAALKEKILDFQNQQMAKLDLIRYRAGQIMAQVEATMKPIIASVADDENIELVLPVSNVLYHAKTVDITQDVIKQLDKAFHSGKLPSLEISLSEGE